MARCVCALRPSPHPQHTHTRKAHAKAHQAHQAHLRLTYGAAGECAQMRGMLKSLNDPYTRFLSPSEFASLSKYDITGVGLNIVDAPDSGSGIKVRARANVSRMA